MDGEDRNDSREVLTRTSHTTGEEITSGVLCMALKRGLDIHRVESMCFNDLKFRIRLEDKKNSTQDEAM
jgi:hypothetical protein